MKTKLKLFLIKTTIVIANIFYFFFKFKKTKDKITILSRQANFNNIDFILIIEYFEKTYPDIEIILLQKELGTGMKNKISYIAHLFEQMSHIASSKVVILDGYSIAISILKHKNNLKVYQIWHSLGAFKKFGYSILDQDEGRDSKIAKAMRMHQNYDYILASSQYVKQEIAEAFNASTKQILVCNLPRVDYILSKQNQINDKEYVSSIINELNNKKETILYVPTHRINGEVAYSRLHEIIDLKKYNFIIKLHNGYEIYYIDDTRQERNNLFPTLQLINFSDYIISDYSAIIYEVLLTNKPLYLYTYDYDTYSNSRGFYIDILNDIPAFISKDFKNIYNQITSKSYDYTFRKNFVEKYIQNSLQNNTQYLCNHIKGQIK